MVTKSFAHDVSDLGKISLVSEERAAEVLRANGAKVHKPAWPDFLVEHADGTVVFTEVKTPGDRLSMRQANTFRLLQRLGFQTEIVFVLKKGVKKRAIRFPLEGEEEIKAWTKAQVRGVSLQAASRKEQLRQDWIREAEKTAEEIEEEALQLVEKGPNIEDILAKLPNAQTPHEAPPPGWNANQPKLEPQTVTRILTPEEVQEALIKQGVIIPRPKRRPARKGATPDDTPSDDPSPIA